MQITYLHPQCTPINPLQNPRVTHQLGRANVDLKATQPDQPAIYEEIDNEGEASSFEFGESSSFLRYDKAPDEDAKKKKKKKEKKEKDEEKKNTNSYFVGNMAKSECDKRVQAALHGQFLVRRSASAGEEGSYVVCVNCKGDARSVRIAKVGLEYVIDQGGGKVDGARLGRGRESGRRWRELAGYG